MKMKKGEIEKKIRNLLEKQDLSLEKIHQKALGEEKRIPKESLRYALRSLMNKGEILPYFKLNPEVKSKYKIPDPSEVFFTLPKRYSSPKEIRTLIKELVNEDVDEKFKGILREKGVQKENINALIHLLKAKLPQHEKVKAFLSYLLSMEEVDVNDPVLRDAKKDEILSYVAFLVLGDTTSKERFFGKVTLKPKS
jgi:hypothetical protein